MAAITGPEFSVSIGADLSGLEGDFAQIGPIIEGATANLQASMAPLTAGTAAASGAFKSFSDAMMALAKAQADQATALAQLSSAMGVLGAAARNTTAPLNDEKTVLGDLGSALEGASNQSKAAGTALQDAGRGATQAGTALGQVGTQASTSLAKAAGAATSTAAAVTDLGEATGRIGKAGAAGTEKLQGSLAGIAEAAEETKTPVMEARTETEALLGLSAPAAGEGPLAPMAEEAKNAWAELDVLKEKLGLVDKEKKKLGAQTDFGFLPDNISDAPDELGQLSLGYQDVANAAEQVKDPVDAANEALENTSGASDKASGGLKGFLGWMQTHRREQVQHARQSRWWAGELLSYLPAAAQAKSGLTGLIGVFIQGAAGGLGFGLALEAVKLGINIVTEAMTRSSKAANELKAEIRSLQIDFQFSARALQDSFGPALSKTEQLIKEKMTSYERKIAETKEEIQRANDESEWKKFWDRWTPGDDVDQKVERLGKKIKAYQNLGQTAPKDTEILAAGRKEAKRAAEDATRDALTLEAQRGSRVKAIRQETANKLAEFDRAMPNQWGQILTQMRGLAKLGVEVPITMDWKDAAAALRKGPLSNMSMVDFKFNWEALQAGMKKRGEMEKTGAREETDYRASQDLAYEQARLRHLQAFTTERGRIELAGQEQVAGLMEERRRAKEAGEEKKVIDRINARIGFAQKEKEEKLRQYDVQEKLSTQAAYMTRQAQDADAYTAIEIERLNKRAELQSQLTEELKKTKNVETERTRLLRAQMDWAEEDAKKKSAALTVQEQLAAKVALAQHEAAMAQSAEATRAARASVDASLAGTAADLDRIAIEREGNLELATLRAKLATDSLKMSEAEKAATNNRIAAVERETQARLQAHDAQTAAYAEAMRQADYKPEVAGQIQQINAQRDAEMQRLMESADLRVSSEQEVMARIRRINEEADVAIWGAKHQYAVGFIDNLSSTWTSGLQRVFEGSLSFRDAINGIWGTIRSAFAQTAASMVMDWAKAQAKRLIVSKGAALADVAIEAGAMIKKTALWVAGGIKDITIKAYRAAASAYAAIAEIPIVGPFLAPAASAAALAAVIALVSRISAAGGYDIPSGVNPMIQAHQEEMVLPAKLANPLRKMLAEREEGDTVGAGGGTTTVNVSLSGMDGASIMRVMRSNEGKSALAAAIAEGLRDGRMRRS